MTKSDHMTNEEDVQVTQRLEALGLNAEQQAAVRAACDLAGGGLDVHDRVLSALATVASLPSETGHTNGHTTVYAMALLDLADCGIPARPLIAQQAKVRETQVLAKVRGRAALDALTAGLLKMLVRPTYKKGERVRVAPGRNMAGLSGRVRKIKREGILHTYLVAFDAKSAAALTPFQGADLVSLEAPATDGEGGYYTPCFREPRGNTVLLNYPDMAAATREGAEICLAAFSNTFTGCVAALNGLYPTGDFAYVKAAQTYDTGKLRIGADEDDPEGLVFNVTLWAGPQYDKLAIAELEKRDAPKPPKLGLATSERPSFGLSALDRAAAAVISAPSASSFAAPSMPELSVEDVKRLHEGDEISLQSNG